MRIQAFLFFLLSFHAALASESSVINEACQDTVQAGSMLPSITTFAALQAQVTDTAKWTAADVALLPSGLVIDPATTTFNSGVLWIRFTLNGKPGQAVAWARSHEKTADGPQYTNQFGLTNKAVLIIPGSGNNEAVQMMANTGYEPALFTIATPAGADGYIVSYVGQDLLGLICQNGKKLIPQAFENALAISGSSSVHYTLIAASAVHTFLKTGHSLNALWPSYPETAIIGLSKGAWNAMMSTLINQPTAAVWASGVSVKEYRTLGFGSMGGNVSAGIAAAWPQATLTAAVKASPSKILYSNSSCNGIAFEMEEAATGETAAAFAGANFTNLVKCTSHMYQMPETLNFLLANMP